MDDLRLERQHARERAFAFGTVGAMLLLYQAPPWVRNLAAVTALGLAASYWKRFRAGKPPSTRRMEKILDRRNTPRVLVVRLIQSRTERQWT